MNSDEIIQKIQAKLAEQNEVIRDQQIQIHEQQQRIQELEDQVKTMSSADAERHAVLSKLAELVD
jgi:hypothetical protein